MHARSLLMLAGLCLGLSDLPASAETQEWKDCGEGRNPDLQIAGCTKVIDLKQETGLHLAWAYNNRGNAYIEKGEYDHAIRDFDEALRLVRFPAAFNGRCFARACAGKDLVFALDDCNRALNAVPGSPNMLDSRGFVYFRMGKFDDAIADYNAALKTNPQSASSLYMRGVSKRRLGDNAGGDADIDAAKRIDSDIANKYAKHGVTP